MCMYGVIKGIYYDGFTYCCHSSPRFHFPAHLPVGEGDTGRAQGEGRREDGERGEVVGEGKRDGRRRGGERERGREAEEIRTADSTHRTPQKLHTSPHTPLQGWTLHIPVI